MLNLISRVVAKFRFKLFRLFSILILGRNGSGAIVGLYVCADLEFASAPSARKRILRRLILSEPCVQTFTFPEMPECWKAMFLRPAVFTARYAYLLDDVVIGPDSGVVFAPPQSCLGDDGIIYVQSMSHHYFLFQDGIVEVLRRVQRSNEDAPVCAMPCAGYYHELLEGLFRVVKAREVFGRIKVLVSSRCPKYIMEMLDFVGMERSMVISSEMPVRVKKGVLIPRWSDCGDNLKSDMLFFRDYIVSKLPVECGRGEGIKLYISRRKSRRPLVNESWVESVLKDKGFCVMYFEDIPFADQLTAIRSADIIVSPHGAALSNMIVAKEGTKIVELMTHGWANSCYGRLASSLGLNYRCIDADAETFKDMLSEIS